MRNIFFFYIGVIMILTCGCTKTLYLEKETPPGTVPPLHTEGPTSQQTSSYISTPSSSEEIVKSYDSSTGSNNSLGSVISEGVIKRFQDVYAKNGGPRIAVFLNRELSDEVREWHTPSRAVTSRDLQASVIGEGSGSSTVTIQEDISAKGKEIEIKQGPAASYEQVYIPLEERPLPPEDWMWQFEESFLQEFLKAKAILVDRATIMRLAAVESGRQGDPHKLLTVKTVEMNALKEKADMFMELLIHRNPDSPVGYEFHVTVKEISTGRILANVTSLEWKQKELEELKGKRFKATDHGYVEAGEEEFPKLDRVASLLALDVMNSLGEIWVRQD